MDGISEDGLLQHAIQEQLEGKAFSGARPAIQLPEAERRGFGMRSGQSLAVTLTEGCPDLVFKLSF